MIRGAVTKDIPEIAAIFREDLIKTYENILPPEYFETLTFEKALETWQKFFAKPDRKCIVYTGSKRKAACGHPDETASAHEVGTGFNSDAGKSNTDIDKHDVQIDGHEAGIDKCGANNESVLGLAGIIPDAENENALCLSSLYVAENAQGMGIGKALLNEAGRIAKEKGAEFLSVSVVLDNERARLIYEKEGAVFEKKFTYYFDKYPVTCGRYLWKINHHGGKTA